MPFPEPMPDPGTDTLRRYVTATPSPKTGRYLDLLHGNVVRLLTEERTQFLSTSSAGGRRRSTTVSPSSRSSGSSAPEAGRCTTRAPAIRPAGTGAATAPDHLHSVG